MRETDGTPAIRTWLRRVTETWAESTITWYLQPNYTTTGTVSADCVEATQCEFDVLASARNWASAASLLVEPILRPATSSCASENAPAGSV